MSELWTHEGDMALARRYPVSVLITAPPDRALAIAKKIADDDGSGSRLVMFDGAAILDPANWRRWDEAGTSDDEDLVVRDVQGLSEAEQAALLKLLDTETELGCRRIIATSSASLFDRVRNGTFLGRLFYRLNVIHIVSDSLSEGRRTSSRPIIAA
jgi:transcriptional regulator of acetoin/glycerol metabolism